MGQEQQTGDYYWMIQMCKDENEIKLLNIVWSLNVFIFGEPILCINENIKYYSEFIRGITWRTTHISQLIDFL